MTNLPVPNSPTGGRSVPDPPRESTPRSTSLGFRGRIAERRQLSGSCARRLAAWVVLGLISLWGCDEPQPNARNAPPAASQPRPARAVSSESHQTIPTGVFQAGTKPGTLDRVPELEPATFEARLGEFRIDTRPYPNKLGSPPRLGVTREEAGRLCDEAGGRLCTELEWERACKGPKSEPFSSGSEWKCPRDECTSAFDVQGLGSYPEWTSTMFDVDSPRSGKPVVRGSGKTAPANHHRCARRDSPDEVPAEQMTFRCCYGAPNAAKVVEPTLGKAFRKHELTLKQLKTLLAADPTTENLADKVVFFSPDGINTVIGRGPGDRMGFDFTVDPLIWQPVAGAEYLIVVGRSGERTSFVVSFHVAGNDHYSVASSFVMEDEPGPVILAYSESIRPRLHFSGCWGCPGETGKIIHRAPERAVILQP